jgi:hypothetical protein
MVAQIGAGWLGVLLAVTPAPVHEATSVAPAPVPASVSAPVPAPPGASVERPAAVLVFTGGEAERAELEASLRELLGRVGVELRADGPGAGAAPFAVINADWSAPEECEITVADSGQRVVLIRRLLRTSSPTVVIEAAAHIIQSVVEELVHAPRPVVRQVLHSVEPPIMVLPREPGPPAAQSGLGLELGGLVGVRVLGGGGPVAMEGGLAVTLRLYRGSWRPALWLSGVYEPPFVVSSSWAQLQVQTLSLRAVPTLDVVRGATWRLDAGVGAGANLFFNSTQSTALPSSRVGRPGVDVSPVFTGLVAWHLGVSRSVECLLAFTLDIDLAPRRFVVEVEGVHDVVFAPARLRPALLLGFSFGALGPEPYPKGEVAR